MIIFELLPNAHLYKCLCIYKHDSTSTTTTTSSTRRDDGSLHRDGDDHVPRALVEMSLENHLQGFALQYFNLKQFIIN